MAFINLPTRRTALLYGTDWHVSEVEKLIEADEDAVARHMARVTPYWYLRTSLAEEQAVPVEDRQ